MYPGNQYYSQHNLNRMQVPNSSTYLQQHPNSFQSMQARNFIQATTQNQSASFQSPQVHNTSRLNPKQATSQQVNNSSQSFSMQSLSWLPNGSTVTRQVPVQQSQYQTQASNQWPHALIDVDRRSFGAVGSNQSGLVNHPSNVSNQGLDFRTTHARPTNRMQSPQFPTVPQTSKVLPPMSQRTSTLNNNMNIYSSNRLLTSNQASLQTGRSNSSNNNRIQDQSNILHSLPNSSNPQMTNMTGILPQHLNINSLSSTRSKNLQQQQPEKRDKIHIRFDQKSKQLPVSTSKSLINTA